jgi:hypothetical protein
MSQDSEVLGALSLRTRLRSSLLERGLPVETYAADKAYDDGENH